MAFNREKYHNYIKSKEWKAFRAYVLSTNLGRKYKGKNHCEGCSLDFAPFELAVHHLHYRTLCHETRTDVALLCSLCHEKADRFRQREEADKSEIRIEDAAFETWATKVYGELWPQTVCHNIYDEFTEWLDSKTDFY